jgi:hypothetical protein
LKITFNAAVEAVEADNLEVEAEVEAAVEAVEAVGQSISEGVAMIRWGAKQVGRKI